ncbi:origin recognition complex subunit 4 [Agrilus planipennis]|uniref:Origin recognition complex subunit 4 n=1 Tax=Agrilus planipennis TaxID=224129 RepID=A0A7F5RBN3_AGRPL|nr:origin recognition complex subunit 4 [Agrilus planipennis]
MENCGRQIKQALKKKILRGIDIGGYVKERKIIFELLKRSIDNGESNSALLIGQRGSGKTTLVNNIIEELQNDISFEENCLLVRLNGLIHTDDKLALKSITIQMNLDNAVDGKVFGSFAENLAFLLACLKAGKKDISKSVIFILEEFDLFCAHHNQTLLYNLFDISQNAQTSVCVLGITCRLDVIELFEKRVKSRFSHRQIFIFMENNLDHRINCILNYLQISKNDTSLNKNVIKNWNNHLLVITEDKNFKNLMQRLLDIDLTERSLKTILISVVSQLSPQNPKLKVEMFQEQMKEFERDDTVAILGSLSALELCLLIAMKHHVEIYDNQAFNFEMIYTRYMKFVGANSNVQAVPRPVVMKAFEHIQNIELIAPCSNTTFKLQKDYQPFRLHLTSDQIMDAVKNVPHLPTELVQWANSSLV